MSSRYCEFASGDDQAVPYAVGMYKEHGGKYIQFSFSVIPRHANNFSQQFCLLRARKGGSDVKEGKTMNWNLLNWFMLDK